MFAAELDTALQIASTAVTGKTRKAKSKIFGLWADFCQDYKVPPSLYTLGDQQDKLSYLLVFALRYRLKGQRNKPVTAGTVKTALTAVGTGIADLGVPNPCKSPGSDKLHPLLSDLIKGLEKKDGPTGRSYPANITILRALHDILDVDHHKFGTLNQHVILLCIIAFYWLLRPAEYLNPETEESRSQAFRLRDIHFTMDGKVYNAIHAPLYDETDLERISYASLQFSDQKNAVKGEQVGHRATSDPTWCPTKALGRLVLHLRKHKATATTPIFHHYNTSDKRWHYVTSKHITNALRHAATHVQATTGIDPSLISARSLRPGGATALLCAGIDKDAIQLLGRWKSDAMLRYLRIQAASLQFNYAQQMLDAGSYTFHPQVLAADGLPNEAPVAVAALLAHDELYEDDDDV